MATSSRKNNESNDYSVEEKIIALYELQKIDSKIDEINKIKGELPLEVQDLEDEIAGLETRIANITSEIDGLTASTKQRKEEIEQAKTLIAKYEHQQDNVRTIGSSIPCPRRSNTRSWRSNCVRKKSRNTVRTARSRKK